jgi:imidazolonepropionase-like amidohydrolase
MHLSWILLSLLGSSTSAFARQESDPATPALLVRGERVILSPDREIEGGAILIQDGRIIEVGADVTGPEGARVLEGKVVVPGFVDGWSTLGVPSEIAGDPQTSPASRTADGLDPWIALAERREALAAGVTAVRSQAGLRSSFGGLGAILRPDPTLFWSSEANGLLRSDACVGASVGLPRFGNLPDVFERIAEVERLAARIDAGRRYREAEIEYRHALAEWDEAIAEKVKELEKDAKKAKKDREKKLKEAEEKDKEFKDEKYKEDKKPKVPRYDEDDAVMARVAEGEIVLVVEVHRAEEIRGLLAATSGFDRLRLVLAGATESLPFAAELATREIPVIVWPAPLGPARPSELERHDLALAGELDRAGVRVLIGSGGAAQARDLRLLAALAVGHGMDPKKALEAITSAPASVFDLEGRIGTIERGAEADLVILDGDPLDSLARVRYVVSAGKVVER